MIPLILGLSLALQNPAVPSVPAEADLFDFARFPAEGVRLVGKLEHKMVPESREPSQWRFQDGVLTASPAWDSVVTPGAYADFRMHVEFSVNMTTDDSREKRGNSGVYIQERYELQILDSFGVSPLDYQDWDCGCLYRLKQPDQLASTPAGAWQTFDIVFRAARFEGERKLENARITVFHNDRLIHDDVSLARKTGAGKPEGPEPLPIKLQGHHNEVGFQNVWIQALDLAAMPPVPKEDPRRVRKVLPRPGTVFQVEGRTAFVIEPKASARRAGPMPWVWYAPTLQGLPGQEEGWMFDQLLDAGIAIAGVDVGESYGSPEGTVGMQALYERLTTARGYAARPVLLARSRGGLMHYGWAVQHPQHVAGIAGIYPVCDLTSYPGVPGAASAFGLSAAALRNALSEHNPIERLAALAKQHVPIYHLHGDRDTVVPLKENSAALAARYSALGGPVEVLVVEGRGHDMWSGWFQSQEVTDFMIRRARAATPAPADVK
ncbi:MAG: hypothetical protein ACJA2W_000722 [Planctomycetota bacterium]|jgi:hypothetical protein